MKFLFFFLMATSFCSNSYSQKVKADTSQSCSQIINELSYYWKLDTLANNGFRRYTYQKFLGCKLDKIYADVLLIKLGKPNEIRRTNKGTDYLYYFFDMRTMPKNYNAPRMCGYINFKFESDGNYLSSIEEGDIDR